MPKTYIPQLDILRLFLFFYILVSHSFIDPQVVFEHTWITGFYRTGWIGVQGFFVLSGFIITRSLLSELQESGEISFRKFYARRALKIIPPLFMTIIIVLTLSQFEFFQKSLAWNHLPSSAAAFRDSIKELPYFLLFIGNIPLAFGHIQHTTPAILITWTLAIEEQFYLIQPAILKWIKKPTQRINKGCWILLTLLFGPLLVRAYTAYSYDEAFYRNFNNTFTLTQIDSLCLGAALALALENQSIASWIQKKVSSLKLRTWLSFLAAALLMLSVIINSSTAITYTIGLSIINLFFGISILLLTTHPRAQIKPNSLSRLGKNGYCLYLIHHIALIIAYELLNPSLALHLNVAILYWLRIACAFFLATVLAKALYYISEHPFEKHRNSLR